MSKSIQVLCPGSPVLKIYSTETPGYAKKIFAHLSKWKPEKGCHSILKKKKKSISLYPYIETQDFYQVEKEKEEEEDKARRQQIVCGNLWDTH